MSSLSALSSSFLCFLFTTTIISPQKKRASYYSYENPVTVHEVWKFFVNVNEEKTLLYHYNSRDKVEKNRNALVKAFDVIKKHYATAKKLQ